MCLFVKQKTAYERRSSDWSSDVCSSDLRRYRTSEPDGLPPERSSIWHMVLQELWKEGLSRGAIAAKLLMPEEELESLLFGLAGDTAPPARRTPDLKAV